MSKIIAVNQVPTSAAFQGDSSDDDNNGNTPISNAQQQQGANNIVPFGKNMPLYAAPAAIVGSAAAINYLSEAIPLYIKKNFPDEYTAKVAQQLLNSKPVDRKEVIKNAINVVREITSGNFQIPDAAKPFLDKKKYAQEVSEWEKFALWKALVEIIKGEDPQNTDSKIVCFSDGDGCRMEKGPVPNGTSYVDTLLNKVGSAVQFYGNAMLDNEEGLSTNRGLLDEKTVANIKGVTQSRSYVILLNSIYSELLTFADTDHPAIKNGKLNVYAGGGGVVLKNGQITFSPKFKDAMTFFELMDGQYDMSSQDQKLDKKQYEYWRKELLNADGQEFINKFIEMREKGIYLGLTVEELLFNNKLGAARECKGLNRYLRHESWENIKVAPSLLDYASLVEEKDRGIFRRLRKAETEGRGNWKSKFFEEEFYTVNNREDYDAAHRQGNQKPLITNALKEELLDDPELNTASKIISYFKNADEGQYVHTLHTNNPNVGLNNPHIKFKLEKDFSKAVSEQKGGKKKIESNTDLGTGFEVRSFYLSWILNPYSKCKAVKDKLEDKPLLKIDGVPLTSPEKEKEAVYRVVINSPERTEYMEIQPNADKADLMKGVHINEQGQLVNEYHQGDSYSDFKAEVFGIMSGKALIVLSLMEDNKRKDYLRQLGYGDQEIDELELKIKSVFFKTEEGQSVSKIGKQLTELENKLKKAEIKADKVDEIIGKLKRCGISVASISRGQIQTESSDKAYPIYLDENLITKKEITKDLNPVILSKDHNEAGNADFSRRVLKLFRPFAIKEEESELPEGEEEKATYKLIGKDFEFAENLDQVFGESREIELSGDSRSRKKQLAAKLKQLKDKEGNLLIANLINETACFSGTVIPHNLRLADPVFRLIGVDPNRVKHDQLAFGLASPDFEEYEEHHREVFAPEYSIKAEDVLEERLLTKENENSLLAKGISAIPKISPGLAFTGTMIALGGLGWELYHSWKNNKIKKPHHLDQPESEDKVENTINVTSQLGQALSTIGVSLPVILQATSYPLSWVGMGAGLTAAFLPASGLQSTLSLLPVPLSLISYAIQLSSSSHGCHNIDLPSPENSPKAAEKLSQNPADENWEFPESIAGTRGKNSNISIAPEHSRIFSKAYQFEVEATKYLEKNLHLPNPIAKIAASIPSNALHSWDMLTSPNLWDFINPLSESKVGTIVNNEYGKGDLMKGEMPIPHSRPHFYNLLGWISLAGIVGSSIASFIASRLKKKEEAKSETAQGDKKQNPILNSAFAKDASALFTAGAGLSVIPFYLVEGESLVKLLGGPPQAFRKEGPMDKYERETEFKSDLIGNSLKILGLPLALVTGILGLSKLSIFHKGKDNKVHEGAEDHSLAEKIHHWAHYASIAITSLISLVFAINLSTNASVMIRPIRERLAYGVQLPKWVDDIAKKVGLGKLSFKGIGTISEREKEK